MQQKGPSVFRRRAFLIVQACNNIAIFRIKERECFCDDLNGEWRGRVYRARFAYPLVVGNQMSVFAL